MFFFILFKHILNENNQKAFKPLKLMCDHNQYNKKAKERQAQSINLNKIYI